MKWTNELPKLYRAVEIRYDSCREWNMEPDYFTQYGRAMRVNTSHYPQGWKWLCLNDWLQSEFDEFADEYIADNRQNFVESLH